MKAYLRKVHKHDLTHEVSVQSYYVYTYFNGSNVMTFYNVKQPFWDYEVVINDVTDPRFGGKFKSIYRAEEPRVGDFLLICKVGLGRFSLELIKPTSHKYKKCEAQFNCSNRADRHAIIEV